MAKGVNTGTTIGLASTLPTTYDDNAITGYASLAFTSLGEVVDIGEIAKAFTTVSHDPLDKRYSEKFKDSYDIGNVSLTIARDTSDAGQVLLAAALGSDDSYAFEVVLPNTNTANFTGKVIKAGLGAISRGSVSQTLVEIAIDPQSLFEA